MKGVGLVGRPHKSRDRSRQGRWNTSRADCGRVVLAPGSTRLPPAGTAADAVWGQRRWLCEGRGVSFFARVGAAVALADTTPGQRLSPITQRSGGSAQRKRRRWRLWRRDRRGARARGRAGRAGAAADERRNGRLGGPFKAFADQGPVHWRVERKYPTSGVESLAICGLCVSSLVVILTRNDMSGPNGPEKQSV